MAKASYVTSYLWGCEERRWKANAVEHPLNTVVAADEFPTIGKSTREMSYPV